MNDPENNNTSFSDLKHLLGSEKWSLYQLHTDDQGKSEKKLLFNDLPGLLIADFFQHNIINKLDDQIADNGRIDLWATGLDDVTWEYRLFSTQN